MHTRGAMLAAAGLVALLASPAESQNSGNRWSYTARAATATRRAYAAPPRPALIVQRMPYWNPYWDPYFNPYAPGPGSITVINNVTVNASYYSANFGGRIIVMPATTALPFGGYTPQYRPFVPGGP